MASTGAQIDMLQSSKQKQDLTQSLSLKKRLSQFQKNYQWTAYIYAIISNVTIVFMQICMKYVTFYVTVYQALYVRGFFLFLLNHFVMKSNAETFTVRDRAVFILLLKRIIIASFTVIFFIGSVKYVPTGTVNSLFNIAPVIICFVEAAYYKKSLNVVHFVLSLVCFVGIIMIVQPNFIFGEKQGEAAISSTEKFFMCVVVFGAFTHSIAMIYLHELKGKVTSTVALHYFYMANIFVNGLAMNFAPNENNDTKSSEIQGVNPIESPQIEQCILNLGFCLTTQKLLLGLAMAGLVIFAFITQNFMTRAMMLKKPSYIMPFGYLAIILSTLTDAVFFQSNFSFLMIFGMILTSSGLLVKVIVPQQANKK